MAATPPQAQARRLELILQQLEQLPTLPAVAVRLLQVTSHADASLREVVELISADVALTTRILALLHRAGSGASSAIASVERAVVLMGFEEVRHAVLALSVFETFGAETPATGSTFSRKEFWKHCIAVACMAELLAEELCDPPAAPSRIVAGEAFVCGLLHDLGKVALDAMLPKSYARAIEASELLRGNIAELERTIIGLDHHVVGKRLAERWNLPPVLRDCIWLHGQAPEALPPLAGNTRLINLITLADALARQQHVGFSGNFTNTIALEALASSIGLSAAAVDSCRQRLMDRIAARAGALQLDLPVVQEMYQQSLNRANQELGRVIEQLAAKSHKMAVRARLFDVISTFGSELRPDASPGQVIQAIGPAALAALGVSAVALFSAMPGQDFAEAMIVSETGQLVDKMIVDCDAWLMTAMESDGPVLMAGSELQWLLGAIDPRLRGNNRYWIRLAADERCIGGVLWGADSGEAQRLGSRASELAAIAATWAMWLRSAQVRESSKILSEQLASANAQLLEQQERLQRGQMMVSVGEMAAGAAHEMNNPLSVISGRSQLLAQQLTDPAQRATANIISEQSQRLSQIITELMDYARPVPPVATECDVAEVVARALHEAKTYVEVADRSIELTMGDVPPILVDEKQVAAALAELILNAIAATDPANGHLSIRAALDPSGSDGLEPGRVVISVTDNGSGMDALTLQRAFDPFFSAKRAGRRRGLGLAKALRWAQGSRGSIRLESKIDQGTRALLIVPCAKATTEAMRTDAHRLPCKTAG